MFKHIFLSRWTTIAVNKESNSTPEDIFGFFGYSFMDLVDHEYVEEVKMVKIF